MVLYLSFLCVAAMRSCWHFDCELCSRLISVSISYALYQALVNLPLCSCAAPRCVRDYLFASHTPETDIAYCNYALPLCLCIVGCRRNMVAHAEACLG